MRVLCDLCVLCVLCDLCVLCVLCVKGLQLFKAKITVTLRTSILDPQGKAVEHGLHSLGYTSISGVRIGKHIELVIETESRDEAERIVKEASERLLSNPVMEDFSFTLEPVKSTAHA